MRTKFVAILAPALALGVLAVTAEAQQHRAIRLGNPATRFAKPLTKADDLRVLLRSDMMKADVAAILNEVGWKGNLEDVNRAAATAEISAIQVPTGARLPFMASRKNKQPHARRVGKRGTRKGQWYLRDEGHVKTRFGAILAPALA